MVTQHMESYVVTPYQKFLVGGLETAPFEKF